jgi:hypothetical protein
MNFTLTSLRGFVNISSASRFRKVASITKRLVKSYNYPLEVNAEAMRPHNTSLPTLQS